MTFNIGRQVGGIINNVAGDQHIVGDQHGALTTVEDAHRAVHSLRKALAAADLDQVTAIAADAQMSEAAAAISTVHPDRPRAADALERLTQLLITAGSLSSATTALITPLRALASWLGTLGQPILHLLFTLS